MDNRVITRLRALLHQVQLLTSRSDESSSSSELQHEFKNVCRLVFDDEAHRGLWDEHILSQLNRLFEIKRPDLTMFGSQVNEIHERWHQSRLVNDFFFRILNPDVSVEKVFEALEAISSAASPLLDILKSSGRLETIRDDDSLPSDKIFTFLDFLREDGGLNILNKDSVKGCLDALKAQEGIGVVNTLLVSSDGQCALMLSLQIQVQPGSGHVHHLVDRQKDFEAVFDRVRHALIGQVFLRESDDILYTLELTEPQYTGTSIALAAAVGIYGAARKIVIDPYTAFTGDINWDRGHWRIQGVKGLPEKWRLPDLPAAVVFLFQRRI